MHRHQRITYVLSVAEAITEMKAPEQKSKSFGMAKVSVFGMAKVTQSLANRSILIV